MKPLHSPLPWQTSHEVVSVGPTLTHESRVIDANRRPVVSTQEYREETFACNSHRSAGFNPTFKSGEPFPVGPNAEFIVRACNAHDALLAALKGLHDDIAEYARINHLGGFDNHWMVAARAAIAKAEATHE